MGSAARPVGGLRFSAVSHGDRPDDRARVRCQISPPLGGERVKHEAHVRPQFPDQWKRDGKYTGANPERTNTLLNRESWEFVRFINPGDNRVAARTCGGGGCHDVEAKNVARSMMTHGAMLWAAALYNNGGFPRKDARFGESYGETGAPQRLIQTPPHRHRKGPSPRHWRCGSGTTP